MKARKNPTQREIDAQYNMALEGDPEAIEWMREQNRLMSKSANQRMRYMERTGMVDEWGRGTAAYNNAKEDLLQLGQEKFLTGKNIDINQMYDNMSDARFFLESQTSTRRGEMKRRERIIGSLEEGGYLTVPSNPVEAAKFKKEFAQFLDSDAFTDLKKYMGTNIIKEASDAIARGAKVQDLANIFRQYQAKNDADIFNVWDSWELGYKNLHSAKQLAYYQRGR